jgi:hypothetical protein
MEVCLIFERYREQHRVPHLFHFRMQNTSSLKLSFGGGRGKG